MYRIDHILTISPKYVISKKRFVYCGNLKIHFSQNYISEMKVNKVMKNIHMALFVININLISISISVIEVEPC